MESMLPSRKKHNVRSKHDQLLETARELISRHGVRRVTVEEICRKAKVSKVTFYKYYPNKQAIVERILDEMVELGVTRFREIIALKVPFEEKLRLIIQVKLEESAKYSEDFLDELIHADPDMVHRFWEKAIAAQTLTMDFFKQAQQDGELRPDMNPDFLQFMLDHVQDLIQDPRLNQMFPSKLDLIRELINFWFYGLLPPGGTGKS